MALAPYCHRTIMYPNKPTMKKQITATRLTKCKAEVGGWKSGLVSSGGLWPKRKEAAPLPRRAAILLPSLLVHVNTGGGNGSGVGIRQTARRAAAACCGQSHRGGRPFCSAPARLPRVAVYCC